MNKLIIVESPTKARTISRFLGKGYEIVATMGHIRDLPKNRFAVKITSSGTDFSFEPQYAPIKDRKPTVEKLKELAREGREFILATDPDREGEAIAYHVAMISSNSKLQTPNSKLKRIVFHEITERAIKEALENPRELDMNLVNAQQARRILDRLVGYKLSPLLWQKIRKGLSAGRVQSVAVRLIVEREREIEKFGKEKFYRIIGAFENKLKVQNSRLQAPSPQQIQRFWRVCAKHCGQAKCKTITQDSKLLAQLIRMGEEKIEKTEKIKLFAGDYSYKKTILDSLTKSEEIVGDILGEEFLVDEIKEKEVSRHPLPPFTTSTLQQTAARRFGWSSKMTMRFAQALYEKGLITYHRTDSFALAEPAIKMIREFVGKEYGSKYLPEKPIFYKTRSKVAQEAHEAIRPTKITNYKLQITNEKNEERLYELIWQRAVACQMAAAKLLETQLRLRSGNYLFETKGTRLLFDGFAKVYPIKFSEIDLPKVEKGEKLNLVELGIIDQETLPPSRYNEASLIAALEKAGIGRPSTYAPIISVIQNRQYVEKEEGFFVPTQLGTPVNDFLAENFNDIVDLPFTAQMEESLDEIARGEKEWNNTLSDFWKNFSPKLEKVKENAQRVKIEAEKTGEKCSQCGKGDLVIRTGRFGKFIACSNFPECKYTANLVEKTDFNCPECGAPTVIRKTKKGRKFFGCSNYPSCKWASWKKPKGNG